MRFGEAVGTEHAAAEHRGQVPDLLLLGAVGGERVGGQGVHADAEADGEAGRGELFEDLEVDLVGLVAAAVLGVVRQAEQAGAREQGEQLAREATGVLLLGRLRDDLLLPDVADERDQVPGLLRGQLPVHRLRGAVGHGGALLPVGHWRTGPWVGAAPPGRSGAWPMLAVPGLGSC